MGTVSEMGIFGRGNQEKNKKVLPTIDLDISIVFIWTNFIEVIIQLPELFKPIGVFLACNGLYNIRVVGNL